MKMNRALGFFVGTVAHTTVLQRLRCSVDDLSNTLIALDVSRQVVA